MIVIIRRIRADEGLCWRDIRLRALQSDPLAFGNTFERAAARPESDWLTSAAKNASSEDLATFFALSTDQLVGLAVVNRDQRRREVFAVYQVWVAPEARGHGVGRKLISALEAWAGDHEAALLELFVSDAAPAARRLYERAGFLPDHRSAASPHPGVTEYGMSKRLR